MDGMATPERLQPLRDAAGVPAEKLFAELMIRHHQGALPWHVLPAETAQTGKVKDFAAGIVQAQSAEIKALEELRHRL